MTQVFFSTRESFQVHTSEIIAQPCDQNYLSSTFQSRSLPPCQLVTKWANCQTSIFSSHSWYHIVFSLGSLRSRHQNATWWRRGLLREMSSCISTKFGGEPERKQKGKIFTLSYNEPIHGHFRRKKGGPKWDYIQLSGQWLATWPDYRNLNEKASKIRVTEVWDRGMWTDIHEGPHMV